MSTNLAKTQLISLRLALTLLLVIALHAARAQQPYFRSLEIDKKQKDLQVYQVEQDRYGFLWLGTNAGVLRFNGRDYSEWPISDSLKSQKASALFSNGKQIIAGFEKGSIVFGEAFVSTIPQSLFISKSAIIDVLIDDENRLWVATEDDGLYVVENGKINRISTTDGLADDHLHCLLEQKNQIYVGTDLGLSVIDYLPQGIIVRSLTRKDGLSDDLITSLSLRNNDIYIGTQSGAACKLNTVSSSITPIEMVSQINTNTIQDIFQVQNETWMLTDRQTILIVRDNDESFIQQLRIDEQINPKFNGKISDAIIDYEGNLVVCNGQYSLQIADTRFTFIVDHEGEPFTKTKALTCSSGENLWFVTDQGIFEHNLIFSDNQLLKKQIEASGLRTQEIICIEQASDGTIWFGTFGFGLGRFDPISKKLQWFTEKDGLLNNNVLSIASFNEEIWLATLGGAVRIHLNEGIQLTNYGAESALGSSYIYTVYSDSQHRLWLGTDGKGPAMFENGNFTFLQNTQPSIGRSIISIAEDALGQMWFYSPDKGLQRWNGESLLNLNLSGLSTSLEVFALQADNNKTLLVFCSAGLILVDIETNRVEIINQSENLTSDYINVISKDKFGQIWLGTNEAMVKYSNVAHRTVTSPLTRIEDVLVMLQSIDTTNHEFSFDQTHFTFRVAGMWYQQPDAVQFQYKLEGYDLDWVNTRDNVLVFPQLTPGTYTFKVRSFIGTPDSNAQVASFTFTIRRPFWSTWWFALFLFGLISFGVWLIVRIRINAIKRKEAIQRELFLSQFETLRNQVNPHFLFNSFNTLISTIGKNQDEAIDYVEKLSDYFRVILQFREKDFITLQEELDLVNHYFFLQKKRFGENLSIEISVDPNALSSLIPPMTLQILAENAIKHNIITKTKPLSITISTKENSLIISNTLQEKKIKDPSTGVGLNNITNRYLFLFNRRISIQKLESTFEIILPIISTKDLTP